MKKVSMIMPCYNSALYLDAMLESIIAQTYDSVELIAAYDNSTDDTLEKLDQWKSRFSERGFELKIVINDERLGIAGGINKALPHFTGDFITFPDSDDYMLPDFCSSMVAALEASPTRNWVRCDNVMISDSEPERIMEYTHSHNKAFRELTAPLCLMLYLIPRSPWRMMARSGFFRSVFPDNAIYQHPSSHEVPLALPLAFAEEPLHLDKPLYKYILHSSAYTQSRHSSIHSCIPYLDSMEAVAADCIDQLKADDAFKEVLHNANRMYYFATKAYYSMNLKQLPLVNKYTEMLLSSMLRFNKELKILAEFNPDIYWRQFYRYVSQIATNLYVDEEGDRRLWETLTSGNLVLYGAGKNCDEILTLLYDLGIKPDEIWDKKESGDKQGIRIVLPKADASAETTVAITILSRKISSEVEDYLTANNCRSFLDVSQLNRVIRYGMIKKYFPQMLRNRRV